MDSKPAAKSEEVVTGAQEKADIDHLEKASMDRSASQKGHQVTDLTVKGNYGCARPAFEDHQA